ncbi:MAG: tRNA pseudouridine(13) synthase TruD [Methanobacteriota archaeon]
MMDESLVGMECHATSLPGIGGKLKSAPEDFVVEELSIVPAPGGSLYTVATVKVRNWEMNRLVRELSRALRISRRKITFAGTKDKRAITTQIIQFQAPLEAVQAIRMPDVEITNAYGTNRKIDLGDLAGNKFTVVLRKLDCPDEEAKARIAGIATELEKLGGFPNFFGVQRFGALRPVTHLVGKLIVQGDFEKAVMTYLGNPAEGEEPEAFAARKALEETHDFGAALHSYPRNMAFELAILNHLAQNPGDYVGAIMTLPKNLQMMFVHAYQSYLFNKMLCERMRRGLPINVPVEGDVILPVNKDGLPDHERWIEAKADNQDTLRLRAKEGRAFVSAVLFGWESVFANGEPGEIERGVVESENLRHEMFMIPQIQRIGSKGSRRELVAPAKDLKWSVADGKATFEFSLNRGCYATTLLREFMKKREMRDY